MKTIIAGSRDITSVEPLYYAIKKSGFRITEVVSGKARGVDTLGELWAELKGLPIKEFYPDWAKYGRAAGPIRNELMAKYADQAIIIWDGKSLGTENMIDCIKEQGKPYFLEVI